MDPTTGRLDSTDTLDATDADEETIEIAATRAEIEQTRAEMSGTIDAIKDKLSPQNLVQQAKETVKEATVGKAQEVAGNVVEGARRAANTAVEGAERAMNSAGDTAREAGSTFMETIQHNPIPSALIGVGLGWLWMNTRKQHPESFASRRSSLQDDWNRSGAGYDTSGYRGGAFGTTYGREEEKGRVSEMADQVQQKASHLGHQAQEKAHRAAVGFEHTLEQHPLAMGAMALTLGAAIGMAIPETRQENRMMGEARDRVVEKAQEATQEVAQKVQSVAQEAMGAAKETAKGEARAQGLTG